MDVVRGKERVNSWRNIVVGGCVYLWTEETSPSLLRSTLYEQAFEDGGSGSAVCR